MAVVGRIPGSDRFRCSCKARGDYIVSAEWALTPPRACPIAGAKRPPADLRLQSESIADEQFAATYRYAGGCKAGVMLRTETTLEGIHGSTESNILSPAAPTGPSRQAASSPAETANYMGLPRLAETLETARCSSWHPRHRRGAGGRKEFSTVSPAKVVTAVTQPEPASAPMGNCMGPP